MQKVIVGQFEMRLDGRRVRMTIDEKSIVCKVGPVTATVAYTIRGENAAGDVLLTITGEEMADAEATVSVRDGQLTIDSSDELHVLSGDWRRTK
ncbi:MAG: hypothetical protein QM770_20560 [Tepidisphaeraceae bacterium]